MSQWSSRYVLCGVASIFLIMGLGGNAIGQTFYKWKDAQGVTHYSETPPVKGNASQVLLTPETPGTSSAAPATAASSAAGNATALTKAEADYQARACEAARRDVAAAKSRAILVDGKDATSARRLSPEERVKAALEAQERVSKFCVNEKTP